MMFWQFQYLTRILRVFNQASDICQFVDCFRPQHRHVLTICRRVRGSYLTSFSGVFYCLLTLLVAVGWSQQLQSQVTDVSAPQPSAKSCGAPPARGIRVNEVDAIPLLEQAVSAMDSTGIYRSVKRFAISGELSDFNHLQNSTRIVGSFHIQEDHTITNGNFSREFVVNGASSILSRTNGQISGTPGAGVPSNSTKMASITKSYLFPLAVLQDELENKNVVAYSVLSNPGMPVNKSLESLQHIVVTKPGDSSNAQNEVEDWYLDSTTHLPVLVSHELPTLNSATSCVVVFTHYGDYQNVSGVLIPTSVYTQRGGSLVHASIIQTLKY